MESASPTGHSDRALECADVLFVGARGSGQKASDFDGFGAQVATARADLKSALGGRRTVEPVAIDYPARGVQSIFNPTIRLDGYLDGMAKGITATERLLAERAAQCPEQRIVLAGYSQGAMVMHQVVRQLAANNKNGTLDRIAAIILIADGDREKNTDARLYGSAGRAGWGLRRPLHDQPIAARLAARTHSVCVKADMVCDTSWYLNGIGLGIAARSLGIALLAIAAPLVANGVRLHTGSAYKGDSSIVQEAAENAANTIMGWPKPTPVTQTLSAEVGAPFQLQLTASVRANAAHLLQWYDVRGLPPGITLTRDGLLSGTLTTEGTWTTTYRVKAAASGYYAAGIKGTITWNADRLNGLNSQMDSAWTNKHVTLYGPHPGTNQISVKSDGYNTTVGLEAAGTSDIDTMRFELSTDGGATWTSIGGTIAARNDDGAFALEWNPVTDSGLAIPTASLLVRAVGHSSVDGLDHPGAGVPVTLTNTQDVMSIAPLADVGVWKASGGAQNLIVSGRASFSGTGTLGIGEPLTGTRISVANVNIKSNVWKTVYDIAPVTANPNFGSEPDQLVLSTTSSTANPAASDTEAISVYNQELTNLQIAANPTNPGNPATNVPVTIKALDQNGRPIAGANFSSDNLLGPGQFAAIGTTNVDGIVDTNISTPEVDFPVQSVNDATVQYIGNAATGSQASFDPALGDITKSLTLSQGFSADLSGSSADGLAFDIDEQDGNDIQIQTLNQTGSDFDVVAPQELTYRWRATPFSGAPEIGTSHTVATEVNGQFDIPVLTGADFPSGLKPGTFELFASLSDGGTGHAVSARKVLTVKAGQATVQLSGSSPESVPGGTSYSTAGSLRLEDGSPLPGRQVAATWTRGPTSDPSPDATIVGGSPLTIIPDATGAFTVVVADQSESPQYAESGTLAVSSDSTPGFGYVGATASRTINFTGLTSRQITVYNKVTNGATAMREDTSPAYLSTVTRNFCKRDGCAIAGTDVITGDVITAYCTVSGDRTTNGQDNSAIDDSNPGLYTSTRWYGVQWNGATRGYISEVWIAPQHRGGLGLPTC
ncbi:cutinase family protein [Nocardioides panacisoli]|uniref:Cutinase family protein n=1 Tax=Nocardioides panacisoli TaxID=627624 RepID=A0ABP7IM55_9ACTN